MRLVRFSIRSFKGLPSPFAAELAPGINVVSGPNEAGKSSFLEALAAAFFTSATTTAKSKVGRWVPWGTKAAPAVEVEFETAGRRFLLKKKYSRSKGRAEVADAASGGVIAEGPQAVEAKLGELLRMGDAAFLLSAWVKQGEIEKALTEAGSDAGLRARLREAAADAAAAVDVRKKVEARKSRLCPPKEVRRLEAERDSRTEKAERVAAALEAWRRREEEAEREAMRLAQVASELERLAPRLEEDAKCREAERARDEALAAFSGAREVLERAEEAGTRLRELGGSISRAERELEAARGRGAAARAALDRARKGRLEEEAGRLAGLERKMEETRKALERPAPSRRELARLSEAHGRAESLRAKIEASELKLHVEALRDLEVRSAGESVRLKPGETREIRGDAEVAVELGDVARVVASGPLQDLSGARRELGGLESGISSALGEWRVRTLDEARELLTKIEEDRRELGRLRRELAASRTEIDRLSAGGAPRGEDAAPAQREAEAASLDGTRLKERLAGLRKEREDWTGRQRDVEKLTGDRDRASLTYVAAKTAAEKLGMYKLGAEERLRLSRKTQNLQNERTALEARLAVRTDEPPPATEDDLAEAEAEREEAERRLAAVKRERAALDLVLRAYERAQAEFADADAEAVRGILGGLLPRLTAGRYGEARLDEKLVPEAVSGPAAEKGAPVGELSAGAREQLALALRLSLVEALSRGERQLVVLDEALLGFDRERLRAACEVLAEYAGRVQILILTARPDLLEFPPGTDVNRIGIGEEGRT
jgi:DNA repair exonuclease SbcCD ATPase subunit